MAKEKRNEKKGKRKVYTNKNHNSIVAHKTFLSRLSECSFVMIFSFYIRYFKCFVDKNLFVEKKMRTDPEKLIPFTFENIYSRPKTILHIAERKTNEWIPRRDIFLIFQTNL